METILAPNSYMMPTLSSSRRQSRGSLFEKEHLGNNIRCLTLNLNQG